MLVYIYRKSTSSWTEQPMVYVIQVKSDNGKIKKITEPFAGRFCDKCWPKCANIFNG